MISFDLRCDAHHVFEAWFRSSADYEVQIKTAMIACPTCGSADVGKAIMAPNVASKGNAVVAKRAAADIAPSDAAAVAPVIAAQTPSLPPALKAALAMVAAAQAEALPRSRWVGTRFAAEARAIHAAKDEVGGEVGAETIIHGQATPDEAQALADDGITVLPLLVPFVPPQARH